MDDLAARYTAVLQTIAAAAVAAGREPGSVRLLAVSKTQPAAAIRALYGAGQRFFGESYAQELASKAAELKDLADLRFVFIGTLQSNKLALIVAAAAAVQSVGDERHARHLARHARACGRTPFPVHLLVNAGGEATKSGVSLQAALPLARLIATELPELRLCGIMAIPPPLGPAELGAGPPPLYQQLRELADQVGEGDLSLGMSADLVPAIAAGSDCVRIGTALFGQRESRQA